MLLEKENLVLVNSFYSNSHLLSGLIEFLEDYFTVHFIDLPGFIGHVPPLETISLETFRAYVRERIEDLDLPRYILGGISFGFLVVSGLPVDPRCLGITAIVPFTHRDALNLGARKMTAYSFVTKTVSALNLGSWAWSSPCVRRFARWYSIYPPERVDAIFDQMDGRTFFETGKLIMETRDLGPFQDLRTVLIISERDTTLNNGPITDIFRRRVDELKIVTTSIEHYPNNLDKDYFRENFREENVREIIRFFNGRPATLRVSPDPSSFLPSRRVPETRTPPRTGPGPGGRGLPPGRSPNRPRTGRRPPGR